MYKAKKRYNIEGLTNIIKRTFMSGFGIKELYYITHKNNIPSILKLGILSHNLMLQKKIHFTPIYDKSIVNNRKAINTPEGKSLWEYANVYFQVRNPMLYRVLLEKSEKDIAVIAISPAILSHQENYFSDGNAASRATTIMSIKEGKDHLPKMLRNDLRLKYWSERDGSKRRIMAECLVPDSLPPFYIKSIFVSDHDLAENLKKDMIGKNNIDIFPDPRMFFLPNVRSLITPYLSIVEGDMFFSKCHTLTISVNTVGVMGKGVASRAKYQFPDVYVKYQDLCKQKKLTMGRPFLIKREKSLDDELADDPKSLSISNEEKWFLLFPTKDDWRYRSNIKGIEQGLAWLQSNYKKEGIKSLALPALGCGLGRLDWNDVGPLMCKYLTNLRIPIQIYLPLEKKIRQKFLTQEFLLKTSP